MVQKIRITVEDTWIISRFAMIPLWTGAVNFDGEIPPLLTWSLWCRTRAVAIHGSDIFYNKLQVNMLSLTIEFIHNQMRLLKVYDCALSNNHRYDPLITALTYLIIFVPGMVTGSIYMDYGLRMHGFPAENVTDGSVLVVKTHEAPPIQTDKFKSAILLIRNPRDAILVSKIINCSCKIKCFLE